MRRTLPKRLVDLSDEAELFSLFNVVAGRSYDRLDSRRSILEWLYRRAAPSGQFIDDYYVWAQAEPAPREELKRRLSEDEKKKEEKRRRNEATDNVARVGDWDRGTLQTNLGRIRGDLRQLFRIHDYTDYTIAVEQPTIRGAHVLLLRPKDESRVEFSAVFSGDDAVHLCPDTLRKVNDGIRGALNSREENEEPRRECHSLQRGNERIFVMLSAFRRKRFFADLLDSILESARIPSKRVEVLVPQQDYCEQDQDGHFAAVLEDRDLYTGGVIVPIRPWRRGQKIRDFVAQFGKPIVFLDQSPYSDATEPRIPNSAFVGSDQVLGGRLAARSLTKALRSKGIRRPTVLVIGAGEQESRQDAFCQEYMEEWHGEATITINKNGRHLREEGAEVVRQCYSVGKPDFSAVFCTNDEMALGAHAVLTDRFPGPDRRPLIFGFDGIEEIQQLVLAPGNSVVGTILQAADRMGHIAISLLDSLCSGKEVEGEHLVAPRVFSPMYGARESEFEVLAAD